MPEPLEGRDSSSTMLSRLRSAALLKLRDRAREEAEQQKKVAAAAAMSTTTSTNTTTSRVASAGTVRGGLLGGVGGGKATAEMLQDLYLKARIREVEETKRVEETARLEVAMRKALSEIDREDVGKAIAMGWDGLQDAIEGVLGDGAWGRCVNNVPDEWEEEEALDAIADLLRQPKRTPFLWLLTK